ncbi:uncharacterized protein HD556DRAFT_1441778 [Suillus plorans]|uniref:Uncharacterized protein n=1 Tax=Suillus plorans TaxID=116603 RepID=A0A9P7AWI1_9AGAM|nr:uncharacterized protein HD556DRAFT_1441778 [Suillus plorans]KAG1795948.1 hypothetical protein HD556DRAFT_1441778 [Suillus plorans]
MAVNLGLQTSGTGTLKDVYKKTPDYIRELQIRMEMYPLSTTMRTSSTARSTWARPPKHLQLRPIPSIYRMQYSGQPFVLMYGAGETAGEEYIDDVFVGGYEAKDQTVGATWIYSPEFSEDGSFPWQSLWSGIPRNIRVRGISTIPNAGRKW